MSDGTESQQNITGGGGVTKITNFTGKNILVEKLVKAQGNSYFLVKKFALKFEEKKWK